MVVLLPSFDELRSHWSYDQRQQKPDGENVHGVLRLRAAVLPSQCTNRLVGGVVLGENQIAEFIYDSKPVNAVADTDKVFAASTGVHLFIGHDVCVSGRNVLSLVFDLHHPSPYQLAAPCALRPCM